MRRFVAFSFLMAANFASANTYHYVVEGYPKVKPDCAEVARDLGDRFASAVGIIPNISLCTGTSEAGYRIDIEYDNDTKVPLVTTWKMGGVLVPGRFATQEECDAVLPAEREIFIHQTGLNPVVAYCQKYDSDAKKVWAPRIDGFGRPIQDYFLNGFALFTIPNKAVPMRARLQETLPKYDAQFVDLVVQSHGPYADVGVHYYAAKPLKFVLVDSIRSSKIENCEAQASQWDTIFATANAAPVVSFCGHPAVATHYEVASLFLGELPLRSTPSQESFKTFELCDAERSNLVAKYGPLLKKRIAGAVCSITQDGSYSAILLYFPGNQSR